MTLKLRFRDIPGRIFHGFFKQEAVVQDAIDFLAKRLKTHNNLIYLISRNSDQLFYKDNERLENIVKSKHDYIIFFKFNQQRENRTSRNKEIFQTQMVIPPTSAINAYNNFIEIQHIRNDEKIIYFDYASIVQNVPDDIQDRVNQIAQLGYDIEDCREALRDAEYDINEAVEILIRRHNNNSIEEQFNNEIDSLIRALYMHLFMPNQLTEEEEDEWEEDTNESELLSLFDSEYESEDETNSEVEPENKLDTDINYENKSKKSIETENEHIIVTPPISPPRMPVSSSPRVSINKNIRSKPNTANISKNQEPTDEIDDQHPRAKQTIIVSKPNRITKPNVQLNQHRPISPRPNPQRGDNIVSKNSESK